jgi:Ca2+-binding EF-hand superfamily protein
MQIASFVRDEVEEMFDRIDENGDRSISFEEYSGLMLELDHAKTDAELRTGYAAIDTDRDGRVNFEEFCRWVTR